MPVHGAVLQLDPSHAARVRKTLAAMPRVTSGPSDGLAQPVVLETPDRAADKELWRLLSELPGVLLVQPVFSDFSDLLEP